METLKNELIVDNLYKIIPDLKEKNYDVINVLYGSLIAITLGVGFKQAFDPAYLSQLLKLTDGTLAWFFQELETKIVPCIAALSGIEIVMLINNIIEKNKQRISKEVLISLNSSSKKRYMERYPMYLLDGLPLSTSQQLSDGDIVNHLSYAELKTVKNILNNSYTPVEKQEKNKEKIK